MEAGNMYLVQAKITEGTNKGRNRGDLRQWECLEVSEHAYKVQDKVEDNNIWMMMSRQKVDTPFWVLKSDVDKVGNTEYQILEKLN